MAAAYDQVVTSTSVAASSEDIGPITPGGADRFLVWYDTLGQTGSTRTLNSITHDSVTGDSRWDTGRFGGYYQTHCHTITGPNAASSVVTGAFSGGSDHGGGIVATFTGVDQTTPFEGLQSNQANDDAPSLTVTSETDDLVVDCIGGDGGSLSVSGGGTEIAALPNISSYAGLGMAYEAGAASVVRSWTWTDGPYYYHAFNLNAAASGTTYYEVHTYTATGSVAMTKIAELTRAFAAAGTAVVSKQVSLVRAIAATGTVTKSKIVNMVRAYAATGTVTKTVGTLFQEILAYSATGTVARSQIVQWVRTFAATATATVTKEIRIIRAYTATGTSTIARALTVGQAAVMTATATVAETVTTFVLGAASGIMKAYSIAMASLFGFRPKK